MARRVRICPSCLSRRLRKYDIYRYRGRRQVRYRCEACGHITIHPLYRWIAERNK